MKANTRFIDLTRDIGFKIVFGDPSCPELMTGLLRALIPEREIASIEFLNTESFGPEEHSKRVNFDILCHEPDGGYFIVEMQKSNFKFFADRLVVYAGHGQRRLLKRGENYGRVRPLYVISILDYFMDVPGESASEREDLVKSASLRFDRSGKVLSDKIKFIFLQLPAVKELAVGMGFLEEFAWRFRNMVDTPAIPDGLGSRFFETLYFHADRGNISEDKLTIYDNMIRDEIQIQAEKEYAVEEALAKGEAKGRVEGRAETIRDLATKMKLAGIDPAKIAEITGLAESEL